MNMKKIIISAFALLLAFGFTAGSFRSAHAEEAASADAASGNASVSGQQDASDDAVSSKKKKYTKKELKYMSSIIWAEAGNQSYAGKLAVGIVVKNRMSSDSFPDSIKGVIYQRGQFTPAVNGSLNRALNKYEETGFKKGKAYKQCLKAAREALNGSKQVKVKGKKVNMKGYYYFSRYVPNRKLTIQAHQFK